jgi:hypothetical protein
MTTLVGDISALGAKAYRAELCTAALLAPNRA